MYFIRFRDRVLLEQMAFKNLKYRKQGLLKFINPSNVYKQIFHLFIESMKPCINAQIN